MSDNTHDEGHSSPIKTPKQLFWVSMAAFVLPVFIIIGLVSYVTSGNKTAPGASDMERAIALRLQKVGTVEIRDANRPLASGEEVYKTQCAACHATGVSGAPKFQNAGDWGPRLGQGYAALLNSSLKGKGAMAPQGGGNFSDLEIGRAVVYMANAAGGKLAEPAAPTGAASAAATAAPAATPAPAAAPAAPTATASPAAAAPAPATSSAAADPAVGKSVYDKACVTCHAAGVAGAPKLGDKAAWGPRIAEGMDTMMKIAINGKGAMPPRGASTASDDELRAAVQYMVDAAK